MHFSCNFECSSSTTIITFNNNKLFLLNSARYDETGNKLLELAPNPGFHKKKYHKKHVKSVLFDIHMLKCSYLSPGFFSFFRLTQQNARASFNTWIMSHSWPRTQHHCTMINSVSLHSPRHESFDHRGLHRRDRKQKKKDTCTKSHSDIRDRRHKLWTHHTIHARARQK